MQISRLKASIIFLTIALPRVSFAQTEYLNEVFAIVEKHSPNKHSMDFEGIKRTAYLKLQDAHSIEDCYPIVRFILSQLNDRHSFFMDKEQVKEWRTTSSKGSIAQLQPFTGSLLKEIAYLRMEGFESGDSVSVRGYADSLQTLIKSLDSKKVKGWIVDLRENTGGNCWPMLAGIGPLLGDGICGYFVRSNQEKFGWFYKDGKAGIESVLCRVSKEPYKLINESNPIAVLTGSKTGSSGEIVAIAFRGKSNATSFGESTAGLSTGNESFLLSDGSMILLTTSKYADRLGNVYGSEIPPDILVHFEYGEMNTENDLVMKRAMEWIIERR